MRSVDNGVGYASQRLSTFAAGTAAIAVWPVSNATGPLIGSFVAVKVNSELKYLEFNVCS